MMIFLSDLHLTDTLDRPTGDSERLYLVLDRILQRATTKGFESATIVFLGDLFDLLKSKLWWEEGVWPWEQSSPKRVQVVKTIFDRIVRANENFFETFRQLGTRYDFLDLRFIPGNHDRLLNTDMGLAARERLLKELSLEASGDQPFDCVVQDDEHRVFAIHGHEWDATNKYVGERAAIGDAVVVKIIARLPDVMAEHLEMAVDDPRIAFLYDLDHLGLHQPQPMLTGLWAGLLTLVPKESGPRPRVQGAIAQAIEEVLEDFRALPETSFGRVEIKRWWEKGLQTMASTFQPRVKRLRLGSSQNSARIPARFKIPPIPAKAQSYRQLAAKDLSAIRYASGSSRSQSRFRYLLCGHTHRPEIVPIDSGNDREHCYYVNTGTWRRIHHLADMDMDRISRQGYFSPRQEECLVIVHSDAEQTAGAPPFHVHQVSRGIA